MLLLTALLIAVMALTHLFSNKLFFLQGIPRSPWLSMAGGISVAYVVLHILPELSASQGAIEDLGEPVVGYLEKHVYLVALLRLGLFYGLERIAEEGFADQLVGIRVRALEHDIGALVFTMP